MKTKEIKLPARVEDLRVNHVKALVDKRYDIEDMSLSDMALFMSLFLNKPRTEVDRFEANIVIKMFLHCKELFAKQVPSDEVPEEITINGKDYELVNLKKPTVGWLMDVDGSNFEKDPVRLACICYIPKGSKYGDRIDDDSEELLYPIDSRYSDFEKYFPLMNHINLTTFFLRQYEKLMFGYMVQKRTSEKILKLRETLSTGLRALTSFRKSTQ